MKFYLIVAKGKKHGMPIPITIDLFLLGADEMCQLRNKNLGAKQCALVTREKKVFIRDFDSGQPTLVNGDLVPPDTECPRPARTARLEERGILLGPGSGTATHTPARERRYVNRYGPGIVA